MSHNFAKVFGLVLVSSAMVLTGCSTTKKPKSKVVVAPVAVGAYGNTAYTGGALVNNPANIQAAAATMQAVVHFDFDSDAIRPDAAAILNQHAQFLAQNTGARVLIAGHTDDRGSREYNMSLGERRAAAVRNYLGSRGATAASVELISYGEEQPVALGQNEAAWAQNRRAELSY